MQVTATAHANIALIKYWGKRDENLFLPTKSSLSVSLPEFTTTTTISIANTTADSITLNNKLLSLDQSKNIIHFLDIFRTLYNIKDHFVIHSVNSFPTAAGFASSSSGFAALTKCLDKLYNLHLSPQELSMLARRGSGSACRSIHDGFVIWHNGIKKDGSDSYTEKLFDTDHWPELTIIPIVVDSSPKKISSRVGMRTTVSTSPHYKTWIQNSEKRLPIMKKAIQDKDLETVGKLAEQDCLEMHKCMQTSTPELNYWQPKTLKIMTKIRALRNQKVPCYFTIDAGPNVKIITLKKHMDFILHEVGSLP